MSTSASLYRPSLPTSLSEPPSQIANGKGSHGRSAAPHGRRYLFDIVSNSTNSIDVDKFDYIMRDSYHTGVKASFELKPVAATMKICDDEIAFRSSQVHNLYELFHSRSSLHRRVYTHPKAKARAGGGWMLSEQPCHCLPATVSATNLELTCRTYHECLTQHCPILAADPY